MLFYKINITVQSNFHILYHVALQYLLKTSFDKDTNYQGRGMGIRKISKSKKIEQRLELK